RGDGARLGRGLLPALQLVRRTPSLTTSDTTVSREDRQGRKGCTNTTYFVGSGFSRTYRRIAKGPPRGGPHEISCGLRGLSVRASVVFTSGRPRNRRGGPRRGRR